METFTKVIPERLEPLVELALQELIKNKDAYGFTGHPLRVVTEEEVEEFALDSYRQLRVWEAQQCPYEILVLQVRSWLTVETGNSVLIGAVDTAYGHDLLFDGKEWKVSKTGIFAGNIIFLSDYYGYPEGALFVKL